MTGLYFYDEQVVRHRRRGAALGPRRDRDHRRQPGLSANGASCTVARLGRGYAWLDTGTFDSLLEAAEFVRVLEQRQGQKIACPEEVAYRMGFIDREQLLGLAERLGKSGYGAYLSKVAEETGD